MWGIHRHPVNSPHKWPVTRKMIPFDDVIKWYPNADPDNPSPMALRLFAGFQRQSVPTMESLQWRYNGRGGVSNHRLLDCLLNRLFRRRSQKTPKLHVTGICEGNSPVTGDFPTQRPVTRQMFPFDDVMMMMMEQGFKWWNHDMETMVPSQ